MKEMASAALSFLANEMASNVLPILTDPIKERYGYLRNYDSNVEGLGREVNKLGGLKNGVESSLSRRPYGHEPRVNVKNWLKSVNSIIKEAEEFLKDVNRTEMWCFNGLCPNLIFRYHLGKQAHNTTEKIVRLQEEHAVFVGHLTIYTAPLSPKFKNEDYEAFESRRSTLDKIMEALTNPSITVIGIWGMGGIGKTMLVKELANKAKDVLFENVVMAVVSKPPDIKEIQGQIAEDLGLTFDRESEFERAHQLSQRLSDGSILVILDNIWENLKLEKVGIPLGCKLVLTSRIREVIPDDMNAKTFEIGQLHEDEARDFFQKRAGDFANDTELKDTVMKVANECANLPLAIVAVAAALKKSGGPHAWKDALQELRGFTPTSIVGIEKEAYRCLKLSYDYLGDDQQAKSLLSLCCLLPEGYRISTQDIIKYGTGLGMFQRMTTLEEARNKVQTLVDHLKDSCLLLDGNTTGFFRIHAVFRDVGINISVASKENGILIVTSGAELRRLTAKDLENCRAMSLPSIDIGELPEYDKGLQCPNLQLLLWLRKDQYSLEIPDTFFKGMEQLKALNLTKIVLSSLPSLSNLQTLCLETCKLKNTSRIGGLKKLEILSFKGSDINELPSEIKELTYLSLLDLSDCSNLKTIPSGVIASLFRLEELYMGNSFVEWKVDGTNASLVELTNLTRLVTLEIGITDAQILPDEFGFEKLKRYRIFVGVVWDCSGDDETSKTLKLKLNTSIPPEGKGINTLLRSTEVLYLDEYGTSSVLYNLEREGFPDLKHLHVQRSSEIEYVIESEEQDPSRKGAFPELESLLLSHLINLKAICHDRLPEGSFRKLRILKAERCGSLEKLFPMSVAKSLLQLQEVLVDGCDRMPLIVANNEVDKITFPQLHSLKLKCLPVLMSFCAKARTNIHSLNYAGEIIPEGEPHIPTPFFNKKVAFPNLKLLNIECCDSLRNLFSPSMANDLVELRALKIINCRMMEEIVEKEKGVKEEAIDKIVFRLLSYITLQDLPKLTSFYPGDHTLECPSLQKLTIHGCPRIKKFTSTYNGLQETFGEGDLNAPSSPFFDEKVVFPCLEEMVIDSVRLKDIWHSQLPVDSFCKLKYLKLERCDHLLNIVPSNLMKMLQNIVTLSVSNFAGSRGSKRKHFEGSSSGALKLPRLFEGSDSRQIMLEPTPAREHLERDTSFFPDSGSLEYIFDLGGLSDAEGHVVQDTRLSYLYLYNLPSLRHIWKMDSKGVFNFENLISVQVQLCENLRNIFTTSIATTLKQLQVLEIERCGVEDIVGNEGVEAAATVKTIVLPQLISLSLTRLEKLKGFCQGNYISEWKSLKKLVVFGCSKVEIFASKSISFVGRHGKGLLSSSTKQPLFLMDEVAFQNLKFLTIECCDSLRNLFSPSMANDLVELRALKIINCRMMEEIIEKEKGVKEEAIDKIVFRLLSDITLQDLPNLLSFYPGNHTFECPSLKKLTIYGCPKIKKFTSTYNASQETFDEDDLNAPSSPFFDEKVVFPYLEDLAIDSICLKDIWHSQLPVDSFCKLKYLKLERCDHLLNIVPSNMVKMLQNIVSLIVSNFAGSRGSKRKHFQGSSSGALKLPRIFEGSGSRQIMLEPTPAREHLERDTSFFPDSGSLEYIFDLGGLNDAEGHVVQDTRLSYLYLYNLPSLRHIWKMDSKGVFNFENLISVQVQLCENLRNIFTTSIATTLKQLQVLEIERCGVEDIVGNEEVEAATTVKTIVLPQLISLSLIRLEKLRSFSQGNIYISEWKSLKKLVVSGCSKVEIFASKSISFGGRHGKGLLGARTEQPLFLMDEVAFPNLEELELSSISNMKESWIDQFHAASFAKLTVLKVRDCNSLTHLLSLTIAKSLVQIKRIIVENCNMMKEVVASEEGKETDETPFSQLISLQLTKLPNLRSFCTSNKFSFLSLEEVLVEKCPKMKTFCNGIFLETPKLKKVHTQFGYRGEVFDKGIWMGDLNMTIQFMFEQKVEFLRLSKLSELEQICHDQFPIESCVVQYLVVEKCTSLLNVVSSNMLESLWKLEEITVKSCDSLEQVFDLEGLNYEEKHDGLLSNLEEMNLTELPKLRCIWNKDPKGILSFRNLRWLKIYKCHSLRNLFSPSIAPCLTGLEELKITNCLTMEEIIGKEKGAKEEAIDKIEFYSVYIVLRDLPNLTSFYPGNHTLRCPRLKTLEIADCGSIKTFTSTNEGLRESIGHGNVDVPTAPLFIDKVAFPNLEELELSNLYNVEDVWQGRFHTPSASKLRSLKVENCKRVLKVFPSPQNLQYLQVLSIRDCPMLQEIFGEEGEKLTDEIVFHQLTSLSLYSLDQLKSFCKATDKMVFPELTSLTLDYLPQLKSLCPGIHVSEYSSLKKLKVSHCRRVQIFASEFTSEFVQPLFLVGKIAFPNLEELQLSYLDMVEKIWQGQFHEQSISNLRVLKVEECRRISQVFPISSIQNLQKLEELSVEKCGIVKYIVGVEREEEKITDKMMLPQLTSLSLSSLRQLKSFCRGIPISGWTSLKKLTLSNCYNVKIFDRELNKETGGTPVVPADQPLFLMDQVAFPDLEELELKHLTKTKEIWGGQFHAQSSCKLRVLNVEECYEISRVFPISLLQHLQNLEVLSVSECSKLKVIFEHEGVFGEVGEASDEIIFSQLKSLELKDLLNLTSFCRGGNTLSFPSLVKVDIRRCPELKTFSDGILNTPKLKSFWNGYEPVWKGDLNTTIQHYFA